MNTFFIFWLSQLLSMIGSGITGFGIGVWVYQHTGSATQFAMNSLFMTVTSLILSQFSGALVDRWDRRWTLVCSDIGAAINTLVLASLLYLGRLEVWHVYAVTISGAVFNSFRWPALNGLVVSIVPRESLVRANGLVMSGEAASNVVAPLLAGMLITSIGLPGVLVIDFCTFLIFVSVVAFLRLPEYKLPAPVEQGQLRGVLHDIVEGWTFVWRRPGLVGLLIFSGVSNFFLGIIEILFTPMVLSIGSVALLGTTSTIAATGMLLGSLAISVWGGPKRRIPVIFGLAALQGLLAILVGVRPLIPLIMIGTFGYMFLFPVQGAASQVIWQTRVPLNMQGRISAVRSVVASGAMPLAFAVAGPLADYVFKPLLQVGGPLDGTWVGTLIGVGPDRGLGLLFVSMGLLSIFGALVIYVHPRVKHLEQETPDDLEQMREMSDRDCQSKPV